MGREWTAPLLLILRVVVLVQCAGLLWTAFGDGTALSSTMFVRWGWAEPTTILVDRGAAALLLGLAVAGFSSRLRWGYGFIAGWFVIEAIATTVNGGSPFYRWALGAHAVRYVAPFVLLFAARSSQTTVWWLRVAVAATFAVHGVEAVLAHPRFVDFLLVADRHFLGADLTQSGAETLLLLIGGLDIAFAVAVVMGRAHRSVLGYMALWGIVTALARVVHYAEYGVPMALIRAANAGVPLALLVAAVKGPPSLVTFRLPNPRVLSSALFGAAGLLALAYALYGHTAVTAQPTSVPHHLRLVWAEDPAHSAIVSWSTTAEGTSHRVLYDVVSRGGQLDGYASEQPTVTTGAYDDGAGPFYHHAELTGLSPSTRYYFAVVSDGEVTEELHFVTAPVDDRPFKFLYGGDSRSDPEDRRSMNDRMRQLLEADPEIIALAHGGDFIADGNDWGQWSSWLDDHELTITADGRVLPVIPARGNHENDGEMFNAVFNWPGGPDDDYYTTLLGANLSYITLDSNSSQGGDQRDWLRSELENAQSGRWIMVNYHRPAYPAVKSPGGALQHWVPLFEEFDVDIVCESDGHVLKRTVPIRNGEFDATGVVYVGEGGLGVSQRNPSSEWYLESPGMAASAHHVQLLHVTPEALEYSAILMDGTVADTFRREPRRTGIAMPPGVQRVDSPDLNRVAVEFTRAMDPATAGAPSAYLIEPVIEVAEVSADSERRTFTLSTVDMVAGETYRLTIVGATDESGIALPSGTAIEFVAGGDPTIVGGEPPNPIRPPGAVDGGDPGVPTDPTNPTSPAGREADGPITGGCSSAGEGGHSPVAWFAFLFVVVGTRRVLKLTRFSRG